MTPTAALCVFYTIEIGLYA